MFKKFDDIRKVHKNVMEMKNRKKVMSDSFTTVIPYQHYGVTEAGWQDGMVTGNGENGAVCSCSPYEETIVYQNMYLIMPSPEPRFVPAEVSAQLEEARQAVINFDDTWDVHGRNRTFLYCYHPAHQLRIKMEEEELLDYRRETNLESAEIKVEYSDRNGKWCRRTFTSDRKRHV